MMTLYKSLLKSLQEAAQLICNSLSKLDPRIEWTIIPGCIVEGRVKDAGGRYRAMHGNVIVWFDSAEHEAWVRDIARRAYEKLHV